MNYQLLGIFAKRKMVALSDAMNEKDSFFAETMLKNGKANPEEIADFLASQLKLERHHGPAPVEPPGGLGRMRMQQYRVIPLEVRASEALVAMVDPTNEESRRFLADKFGVPVRVRVVSLTEFDAMFKTLAAQQTVVVRNSGRQPAEPAPRTTSERVQRPASIVYRRVDGSIADMASDNDALAVKLVDEILRMAVLKGATDVHFEASNPQTIVRLRVDGMLHEARRFDVADHPAVVNRIKTLGELDIANRRTPQDGRLAIEANGMRLDCRISTLPSSDGEKVVIRLLNSGPSLVSLKDLSFKDATLEKLAEIFRQPQGMFLVTGPTGSGKSSTLRAGILEIMRPEVSIVSIENPIEYRMPGINQIQVNEKAGLGFSSVLRSVLRQDPDVILLGEIRDGETADIAFKAASTGHLMLSTLHTNDAPSAIQRLLGLDVPKDVLGACLKAVLAQRLFRLVCANCVQKVNGSATPAEALRRLKLPYGTEVAVAKGCPECLGSGYRGRKAVEELFTITPTIALMIEKGKTTSQLREQARQERMLTLVEAATECVTRFETTPEEALRVVGDAAQDAEANGDVVDVVPIGGARAAIPMFDVSFEAARTIDATAMPRLEGPSGAPSAEPAEAARDGNLTILIVDDNPSNRLVLEFMIKKQLPNARFLQAESAKDAVLKLVQCKADLIFSDICMPEVDGFELSENFRSHPDYKTTPIIFVSAMPEHLGRERSLMAGGDAFLSKPITVEALEKVLARFLKRVMPQRACPEAKAGFMLPHAASEWQPVSENRVH